ncbi:MAG TPA: N,N-dimethylformamidase beta subunit family domain-containing protein, partial [Acidothermaceae bacterium]|nr:N,N-dimethylformamidase beta subunit family domain-containing protein [Acidothermaceae bacterium]
MTRPRSTRAKGALHAPRTWRRRIAMLAAPLMMAGMVTALAATVGLAPASAATGSPCGATINPVTCENRQPGTPQSVWDVTGAGDPSIQGFTTDISVNVGGTVNFKIDTNAAHYTIDIYRLGYYGGLGARKVTSISPSATLPQVQPNCLTDPSVTLVDCGDWGVSASWAVPSTSVSGVYIAHLTRTDTGGESLIPFIVRNDASTADIVYQTSDPTWEAYNRYGDADFYTGSTTNLCDSPSRAREISYNRPFATRGDNSGRDFLFSNEYPTIRFLEENGYDVTYISGVDTDRYGATQLKNHKVFMSVGHDEYWSQAQRTNVENARDAGVNLMFLSGNEVFWHTRYGPSIDGTNTAYRTLICYKETWDNAPTDPSGEATATWRDPRFSAAPGGSNPENALTGTMYMANSDDLPLSVTAAEGKTRLWRNTGLSSMSGGSTDVAQNIVGYESDEDLDNGFRNSGQVDLSTTVGASPQESIDFGQFTAPGTTTHHITLYRAASGALVFSAGTIQWGWGLDATHDGTQQAASPQMQQAMVNLYADMHVQPQTLLAGLVAATASTDT